MFSMAVAGLVKSLISVTITLNPAAAHGPGSYTIRPGDTLSQIAARAYGSAGWIRAGPTLIGDIDAGAYSARTPA